MLKSTIENPGWLIPYLLALDSMHYRRWEYWMRAVLRDEIPDEPIPVIRFEDANAYQGKQVRNNLESCIGYAERYGSATLEKFIDWILWGLGYKNNLQFPQIDEKVDDYWYRTFNLGLYYLEPADHWAHFAGEYQIGSGTGFFSTPMNLTQVMVRMTLGDAPMHEHKIRSVMDPCCGTGSMLLAASNYSLNLYGTDIHPTLCKMAILNGYIYVPWLIHRPKQLTMFDASMDMTLSDAIDRPVCEACGNSTDYYADVLTEISLEMNEAGCLDIDQGIAPSSLNDETFQCVTCNRKEMSDANSLLKVSQ